MLYTRSPPAVLSWNVRRALIVMVFVDVCGRDVCSWMVEKIVSSVDSNGYTKTFNGGG